MKETHQLADELERAWEPWRIVLGGEPEITRTALQERSTALWVDMGTDRAPEVAQAVLKVLWGAASPPATWWRSPLGRVIGQALPDDVALTNQQAADILGVTRGTISNLVARGSAGMEGLDQVHDTRPAGRGRPTAANKISLRSVIARLDKSRAPGRPPRG